MNNAPRSPHILQADADHYGADDHAPFPGATWHYADQAIIDAQRPAPVPTIADEIVAFMGRFIAFTDKAQADALALWVIHTHAFNAAFATPYIYVTSAEKQSGKTRVIEVLTELAYNASPAANMSQGAMYAKINADAKPTILLDEVDTIFTGAANEELRGMLNSGYKHNGYIERQTMGEGGIREVARYSTFCPKLLAGIDNGALPDTLMDRCIRIVLKRKRSDQNVERLQYRKFVPEAELLKAKIQEWVKDHIDGIIDAEPTMIDEIGDRAFDISEPLLQIAMQLPGWTARSRRSLTHLLSGETTALSVQAQALHAARNYMNENQTDRIRSSVLAALVGIDTRKLSNLLAPYDIKPSTYRFHGEPNKGYTRKDFEDAWSRYL